MAFAVCQVYVRPRYGQRSPHEDLILSDNDTINRPFVVTDNDQSTVTIDTVSMLVPGCCWWRPAGPVLVAAGA